ncbi:type II CAAX prenyl endopeptidase Rce1 family protein [Novipirellula sp.]|uniref:CPBP family glutamic-type intramembrane protease n=1 Tax=Novipirellula sp. TaxID=2795430 RepID=UPI0035675465
MDPRPPEDDQSHPPDSDASVSRDTESQHHLPASEAQPLEPANPYAAALPRASHPVSTVDELAPPLHSSIDLSPERFRWWTTIAVVAASLGVFLFVSMLTSVLAFLIVHGGFNPQLVSDPNALGDVMKSRIGIVMIILIPQLAMIVPSLFASLLSPVETRKRLSLVRGRWPVWVWFAAALATPLVGLISSLVVGGFMEESESLKVMSEAFRFHGNNGFLIPIALLIGATPALCEEILFRGYVQTRLAKSFGPLAGILVSSFLFAAFHMDFVHIVAVFPLGVYLGFLSWKSGSLFPAMLAHFVNNVISVVAVCLAPADKTDVLGMPSIAISVFILGFGIVGIASVFFASVYYRDPETIV